MEVKARSLVALHTHTHTHRNNLEIGFANKSKLALVYEKIEENMRLGKHTKV